ncbi:MAG: lysine--tRNA ligase [Clostridiales bacterium]|nr:lysine--tRNA ligase [Clostridiales bacterium]
MTEEQIKNTGNAPEESEVSEAEELSAEDLNELRLIRREKLAKLREAGRDPYLNESWDVTDSAAGVCARFEAAEEMAPQNALDVTSLRSAAALDVTSLRSAAADGAKELPEIRVSLAGRIMANRHMGKASFIDVHDKSGKIQVYVRRDVIGDEEYEWFLTDDIGDIVGVSGTVFRTRHGEITVRAERLVLLSKSLQILPNKWQGLRDNDLRYRQRYVDLIMNPDVRETFLKRAKILREIRRYLEEDEGFLDVDTPILTVIAGGANARPFATHHNTLDIDMKLRISNELYLKRLVVGGFDRVYEMGKMFRNEGMDRNHNPEFTAMELYQAYGQMEDVMRLTEQIVYHAALAAGGSPVIEYQGKTFDLTPPWDRLSMQDAIRAKLGEDFDRIETDEEARAAAKKHHIENADKLTRGKIIAELFEAYCEDDLDGPVFITGHPVEISPLAKRDASDPRITRRFEAYINTWEVANGFSELNDPIDQLARFQAQQAQLEAGDSEAHPMDEDFVNALKVGMPPTGGLGVGIDRVIMLLTNAPSIRDIILFPTMKP